MAIILAGVELHAVAAVRATEERHIVRQHIPGFEGDVLQDIGRGPAMFALEGVLHGDRARSDAEALRAGFRNGVPVELVAALATTLEVQQVLIRSLELREQAGWPTLIELRATVVEYIEPPVPAVASGPSGFLGGLGGAAAGAVGEAADGWRKELGTELSTEAIAREIAEHPERAKEMLDKAAKHPKGILPDVLVRASTFVAENLETLAGFLGSAADGAPALLAQVGKTLGGDSGKLAQALGALGEGKLTQLVEHIGGPELAQAIQGAADELGVDRIGAALKAVAKNGDALGEVIESLADGEGVEILLGGMLGEPGLARDILDKLPDLLEDVDLHDLAGSIKDKLGELAADELGDIFSTIAGIDIDKAGELFDALREAGSLSEIAQILVEGDVDIRIHVPGLGDIYIGRAFLEVKDFLDKLDRVWDQGRDLVKSLADLDPLTEMNTLLEQAS